MCVLTRRLPYLCWRSLDCNLLSERAGEITGRNLSFRDEALMWAVADACYELEDDALRLRDSSRARGSRFTCN